MGMTIDEALKELNRVILCLTDGGNVTKEVNALEIAIDTMRKYQKIEQILDDCDLEAWQVLERLKRIRKVVEDEIDSAPTVEAIPKADYENRLKADMVAMLEEISLKFDEQYFINRHQLHDDSLNRGLVQGQDIIQQKINSLKENKDG